MTAPAVAPVVAAPVTEASASQNPVRTDPMPRRLRVVPSEPPYEDAPEIALPPTVGIATLPFERQRAVRTTPGPLPTLAPLAAPPHRLPAATPVPTPCGASRVDSELRALFGPRRTTRSELPDPRERAASAVRILLEVLAGDRPARQVAAWVSPTILERLESHRATAAHRRARRTYVRSLRISEPSDAIAEVTAVVTNSPGDDARRRAVALRLEGRDGRWTVTALAVG